jgi:phospholipid-transporting ATPase
MANVYFLLLGLLELIKPISDAGGEPVMLVPLSFIILVSMMKDIVEDYQRHKSDNDENERELLVAGK